MYSQIKYMKSRKKRCDRVNVCTRHALMWDYIQEPNTTLQQETDTDAERLSKSILKLRVQMGNALYIKPIRGAVACTDHQVPKTHS
jgi:hypothetical protein